MDDAAREEALCLWELSQGETRIPVWLDCDTGSYSISDLIVSICRDDGDWHDNQMFNVRYK